MESNKEYNLDKDIKETMLMEQMRVDEKSQSGYYFLCSQAEYNGNLIDY